MATSTSFGPNQDVLESNRSTLPGSREISDSPIRPMQQQRESFGATLEMLLKTKRAKYFGFLTLLSIIAGILALTVPKSNASVTMNPILAYKNRYAIFRIILDRHSHPWTFALPNSPQSKALHWLVFQDKSLYTEPVDETRLVQRYALLTLFYACAGHEWTNLFTSAPPLDEQVDSNECDFPGIACNEEGAIVSFEAANSNLVGHLPDEISLLTRLTHLNLYYNELEGTLPVAIFEKLTNLGKLSQTISAPKLEVYLTLILA